MLELKVDLMERSYPIFIGSELCSNADYFQPYIKGRRVAIVTNGTVAAFYLDLIKHTLANYELTVITLPDGEKYKNLDTLNLIFDQLLQERHTRKTTLLALGGGVIGDMTGFAAACYQRGVDFIQVPTTLLSQVDSSVGGKTGVNHALGKNMIGAFYQPNAVIIDTTTLNTLPDRELSAGLAEVIKYGLICDKPFYQWLQENIGRLRDRDPEVLSYAIHQSCQDKARVVEADETESGIRAILNLGHTFGHAIETHMGYGSWLHGEAVSAGMVMAADLSCREGNISREDVDGLVALLESVSLPVMPPAGISPERFLELMAVDKKVLDGQLRLVLLDAIGNAVVTDRFSHKNLMDSLQQFST
ncbi:3-dehydroquinate synthase [Endozoicomonas sp. SCSIO W0465]|uniref:3-dehydroquinate synthase n=1 Tax=Endozoicomonas sp. SCSIO W0465 TaxID=2918516 RepID=UPI0020763BB7|nr:3-dehydroquinate synthase [Endozoicomonas sp. SCSIO W0465]USE35318.1 3-dehydroquinate synthase [Endozoicomonas sp. SCSIO W0465]